MAYVSSPNRLTNTLQNQLLEKVGLVEIETGTAMPFVQPADL